ncbi:MAG: hypothetical protein A2750_02185 [Candidatus Yanofskybacteria bacterium RIFCSPHIGHO2_01_FULL_45_42]|uniref:Uncharacterized protein n=2 Tax=Candidatus Yanofskyibacteriota TaxID=1752733 RepID=A0A1F8FUM7_9BACT|nr:MAG: hypothetical protein A2750_02185 [Candidatus Yanofskybacteria bacterium RIFCSPHIGHO2_01_FULL_45_42]OGN16019.1 MAG: hypothetical protein A3J47_04020 [Candidatus Yanofskybacteria bacterium RIFCSPHIGHO2_02_FULL_43_22]
MISCFVCQNPNKPVALLKNRGLVEILFDLNTRQARVNEDIVLSDFPLPFTPTATHLALAERYFKEIVGTPTQLMDFALESGLSKLELANLLMPEKKKLYLGACARFEKALTEACTAKNDPCLEGGCAMIEEEVCLSAILEAGKIYTTAYVSMWINLFVDPSNRIPAWRS